MDFYSSRHLGSGELKPYNIRSLVSNRFMAALMINMYKAGMMSNPTSTKTEGWVGDMMVRYTSTVPFFKDMINVMRINGIGMNISEENKAVIRIDQAVFLQRLNGPAVSNVTVLLSVIEMGPDILFTNTPSSDIVKDMRDLFVLLWLFDIPCFGELFDDDIELNARYDKAQLMWNDNSCGIKPVVQYASAVFYSLYDQFVGTGPDSYRDLITRSNSANGDDNSVNAFVIYNAFDMMQTSFFPLVTNLRNAMNNANNTGLNNMPDAITDIPFVRERFNIPVVTTTLDGQQVTAISLDATPVTDTSITGDAASPQILVPLASNPNLATVPPLNVISSGVMTDVAYATAEEAATAAASSAAAANASAASNDTEASSDTDKSEGGINRVYVILFVIIAALIWSVKRSSSSSKAKETMRTSNVALTDSSALVTA